MSWYEKLRVVATGARVAFWLAVLVAVLSAAVHFKLWLQGAAESVTQTVYRTRTVYRDLPTTREWDRAEKVTVPCVAVRVAARTPSTSASSNEDSPPEPPRTSPELPFPLRLGEWQLPVLPSGGKAVAELDESGDTRLQVTSLPRRFLELGSLRELAVWVDPGLQVPRTWAISYQQDIVRVGPALLRGRAEYGQLISHEALSPHWKVELGLAVRF